MRQTLPDRACRIPAVPRLPGDGYLLRQDLARSAHLLGQVIHLGETVLDAKDCLSVVDVNLCLMAVCRDRRGVHVDEAPQWMVRHEVPAAQLADFAVALFRLLIDADAVLALGDFHRFWLPETE